MTTYRTTLKLTDVAHVMGRGELAYVLPEGVQPGDIVLIQPDSDVYRATERAATRQTIRRTLRDGAQRDQR